MPTGRANWWDLYSQAQETKVPVEDAVWFQGPAFDLPLTPRKQSNHVSPQTFLPMSKKHLFKLRKLTGFWFDPRATQYLLSIPSDANPHDPDLEALRAAQVRLDVLKEVLGTVPELSAVIPEDPYRLGFRDGHKDLRKCLLRLIEESKRDVDERHAARRIR